jgi:hypothetical protein
MTYRWRDEQIRQRIRLGSGRETDLTRRANRYEQRTAILIATNGESTERKYFDKLRLEDWVRAGRVAVVFESGAPTSVVRGAARRRDRDDFDQAWAVCDVDQFDTSEATTEAAESEVLLVWSNPCFELWLLLHLSACDAYLEDARRAHEKLRGKLPGWDKTKFDYHKFREGIDDAIERAKGLGEPPGANPSTAVWRIVEALR